MKRFLEEFIRDTATTCPYRCYVNPKLVFVEYSVDILKQHRCIIRNNASGRKRMQTRISDRKFSRRKRGVTYYLATLPAGWTVSKYMNQAIVPRNDLNLVYVQMLSKRQAQLKDLKSMEWRMRLAPQGHNPQRSQHLQPNPSSAASTSSAQHQPTNTGQQSNITVTQPQSTRNQIQTTTQSQSSNQPITESQQQVNDDENNDTLDIVFYTLNM